MSGVTRNIPEGDEAARAAQWATAAARVEGIGRAALAAGHRVSAREALLRASNYHRVAGFYLRTDGVHDEESARLDKASQQTFADAAPLLDTPARALEIPYEGTTLPAYLFLVDDSGLPRPTVIFRRRACRRCQEGALSLFSRRTFDWLDTVLAR